MNTFDLGRRTLSFLLIHVAIFVLVLSSLNTTAKAGIGKVVRKSDQVETHYIKDSIVKDIYVSDNPAQGMLVFAWVWTENNKGESDGERLIWIKDGEKWMLDIDGGVLKDPSVLDKSTQIGIDPKSDFLLPTRGSEILLVVRKVENQGIVIRSPQLPIELEFRHPSEGETIKIPGDFGNPKKVEIGLWKYARQVLSFGKTLYQHKAEDLIAQLGGEKIYLDWIKTVRSDALKSLRENANRALFLFQLPVLETAGYGPQSKELGDIADINRISQVFSRAFLSVDINDFTKEPKMILFNGQIDNVTVGKVLLDPSNPGFIEFDFHFIKYRVSIDFLKQLQLNSSIGEIDRYKVVESYILEGVYAKSGIDIRIKLATSDIEFKGRPSFIPTSLLKDVIKSSSAIEDIGSVLSNNAPVKTLLKSMWVPMCRKLLGSAP